MQIQTYTIRFNTPAFLGNAEQKGQWRTPPFKHLLREWWRVAWAEENGYSNQHADMREQENKLFGSAGNGEGCQSLLRLRLDEWKMGNQESVAGELFYLGYGRIKDSKGKVETPSIAVNSENRLSIACPESFPLSRIVNLANNFGTIGGRSRNGWGSLSIQSPVAEDDRAQQEQGYPQRNWVDCLDRDWAHAIGTDEKGPLIWCTDLNTKWEKHMSTLVNVRKEVNAIGKKSNNRQWINQPVKNWNERIPNSLRFKLCAETTGKLYGVVFHMPCLPAKELKQNQARIKEVWKQIHMLLDGYDGLSRSSK